MRSRLSRLDPEVCAFTMLIVGHVSAMVAHFRTMYCPIGNVFGTWFLVGLAPMVVCA